MELSEFETTRLRILGNNALLLELADILAIDIVEFLPFLVAAILGGLIARQVVRRRGTPPAALPGQGPSTEATPAGPLARAILGPIG